SSPSTSSTPTDLFPLSLHDALPIFLGASHTYSTSLNDRVLSFTFDHIMLPDSNTNEPGSHGFAQFSIRPVGMSPGSSVENFADRSEEHTSELQSRENLVCRRMLEKK